MRGRTCFNGFALWRTALSSDILRRRAGGASVAVGASNVTVSNAVEPSSARDDAAVGTVIRVIVGGVAIRLLAAALGTQIEYYDGLSAIANARYFLGTSEHYIADRGPLMAWLLMPAEWVRSTLGLHTLDVRPHHALLAVL